jgi:hypothetical protein
MSAQASEAKPGNGNEPCDLDTRVLQLQASDFVPVLGSVRFLQRTMRIRARLADEREGGKYASREHERADWRLLLSDYALLAYNVGLGVAAYQAYRFLFE